MTLEAVSSSLIIHPTMFNGVSPSGKAQDFDSCIPLVRIQLPQPEKAHTPLIKGGMGFSLEL